MNSEPGEQSHCPQQIEHPINRPQQLADDLLPCLAQSGLTAARQCNQCSLLLLQQAHQLTRVNGRLCTPPPHTPLGRPRGSACTRPLSIVGVPTAPGFDVLDAEVAVAQVHPIDGVIQTLAAVACNGGRARRRGAGCPARRGARRARGASR